MKVALYGGIILSLPFILFFIAQYVMPALKAKEKKYFARAFIIGGGLFMAGVMLCYFVILPISLKGVAQYTKWLGFSIDIWRGEEVFQFVILFMLGMGVSFELPVVLLTLVRLGILQHEWLVKGRRYFLWLTWCSVLSSPRFHQHLFHGYSRADSDGDLHFDFRLLGAAETRG